MSWLSKLFGRHEASDSQESSKSSAEKSEASGSQKPSPNNNKSIKCFTCSKIVKSVRSGMNMLDMLKNAGYRCPACKKVACGECAARAAQQSGANVFLCPSCGTPLDRPDYSV